MKPDDISISSSLDSLSTSCWPHGLYNCLRPPGLTLPPAYLRDPLMTNAKADDNLDIRLELLLIAATICTWRIARKAAIATPNPITFSALANAEYTLTRIKVPSP